MLAIDLPRFVGMKGARVMARASAGNPITGRWLTAATTGPLGRAPEAVAEGPRGDRYLETVR